jgi:hypothetical protein
MNNSFQAWGKLPALHSHYPAAEESEGNAHAQLQQQDG